MRETIDRALRRQRIAAAVAGAVGLLWGLAARWVGSAGAVALLTLVPILVLLWAMLRAFGRPGTGEFRVDEREHVFFLPSTGRMSYRWIVLAFATYTTTNQLASDREGLWWLYPILTGPLAVALAVALWRRVPECRADPGRDHRRRSAAAPLGTVGGPGSDGSGQFAPAGRSSATAGAKPEPGSATGNRLAPPSRGRDQRAGRHAGAAGRCDPALRQASRAPHGDRHAAGARPAA